VAETEEKLKAKYLVLARELQSLVFSYLDCTHLLKSAEANFLLNEETDWEYLRQTHFKRGREDLRTDDLQPVATCARYGDRSGCTNYYYTCQSLATHPVSVSAGLSKNSCLDIPSLEVS